MTVRCLDNGFIKGDPPVTDQPKVDSSPASQSTDADNLDASILAWLRQLSAEKRFKFFLTGVVFPILCFLVIGFEWMPMSIDEPWQSGRRYDYVTLLLRSPSIFCFTPLLSISIACMAIWCFRTDQSSLTLIRLGLYAGTLLSAMFLVLLFYTTFVVSEVMAVFVGIGLAIVVWVGHALAKRYKRFSILHMLVFTTVIAIMVAIDIPTHFFRQLIAEFFFVTIAAAPTLCFITYSRVSFIVFRATQGRSHTERPIAWIVGWCIWSVGLFVSWKYAIAVMLIEYAKLPTVNPNCYISGAAAHGHARWVGSRVETTNIGPVNLQMRRLKLLEFGLAAASPRSHRQIRTVYNWLGPRLAQWCAANVWFADVTYLILKPLEWLAILVRWTAGISEQQLASIYRVSRSLAQPIRDVSPSD